MSVVPPICRHRIPFALLLVLMAILFASGCVNHNELPVDISGSTSVEVSDVTSVSDLNSGGVYDSALVALVPDISRFDVVTFNLRAIRDDIRSNRGLRIRINGRGYTGQFTQPGSVNPDNGFETYFGVLQNEPNSSVLITVSPTSFLVGSIAHDNTTYWIMPVDKEKYRPDNSPVLHVIYEEKDAKGFQNPNITGIFPSETYLHSYHRDAKTGIARLTEPSLIGMESPATDGDHIVWSWVYYGKRGLTLYSIPAGKYTEISAGPFGLSPPKISGNYIVWADSRECVSGDQTHSLVLYDIVSGTKTCICSNPKSPRYASVSGNYVVWEDNVHRNTNNRSPMDHYLYNVYLYDIRAGKESVIMPNVSTQEYPTISGDRIVWSDSRNYPPGGNYRDIFLYSIPYGNVTIINKVPLIPSPPYIHGDYVLWSDRGTGPSSRVHLYTISTGEDRVLDDSSSGYVTGFSLSGDYIVWTAEEFRGNDIPDAIPVVYDLRKGAAVSVCPQGVTPFSVSGNTFLVADAGGIGFCRASPNGYSDPDFNVPVL